MQIVKAFFSSEKWSLIYGFQFEFRVSEEDFISYPWQLLNTYFKSEPIEITSWASLSAINLLAYSYLEFALQPGGNR